MPIIEEAIRSFYEHSGRTLTSGRPEAIAACYIAPALIVGADRAIPIADVPEVAAAFDGSAERYAAEGLVGAVPTVVAVEHLTDTLASVDVHWGYTDAEGVSQSEDGYRYLLRLTAHGLRIQVVSATPERLKRA